MKKLIIINQEQFGYHTDTYSYCKYLKDDFGIVYICWDQVLPKIEMAGVKVVYVSREGNMLVRTMRFLRQSLRQINDKRSVIFVKYFKVFSLLLRLLRPSYCFVLDIRTASIDTSLMMRKLYDARLKFETRFFRHVTVVSERLAQKLCIAYKSHILPLGADIISSKNKSFESMRLLYVGTLSNRNIDITIHGFKKFYDKFEGQMPISYTIIGDGSNNEVQYLKGIASKYGLTDVVKLTGYILHTELVPYFNACNIGVSYVPLTDYYDCQPVTKTYEYLLSGMPVIATNTSENRSVINLENGVLIGETVEEFTAALEEVFEKRYLFDSEKIRNEVVEHAWEKIIRKNYRVYLSNIEK